MISAIDLKGKCIYVYFMVHTGLFRLTRLFTAMLVLMVGPSSIYPTELPGTIEVGDTVKVTAPSNDIRKRVGIVLSNNLDTIVIAAQDPSKELTISFTDITVLQVQRGKREEILPNALAFGGLGFCVGGVIGYATRGSSPPSVIRNRDERMKDALSGGLVIGAIGVCVGVAFAEVFKRPDWKAVTLWSDEKLSKKSFGLAFSMQF